MEIYIADYKRITPPASFREVTEGRLSNICRDTNPLEKTILRMSIGRQPMRFVASVAD